MKRSTRKKLIKTLNDLIWLSSGQPVRNFIIRYLGEYGLYDLFDYEDLDLDGVVSKLMELSLTHRVAKIHHSKYVTVNGMCVCFFVIESKDGTTNIDADMMDLILRLNFKKVLLKTLRG